MNESVDPPLGTELQAAVEASRLILGDPEFVQAPVDVSPRALGRSETPESLERYRDRVFFVRDDVVDMTKGEQWRSPNDGPVVTETSHASARDWFRSAMHEDGFADIVLGGRPASAVDMANDEVVNGLVDAARSNRMLRRLLGGHFHDRVLANWSRLVPSRGPGDTKVSAVPGYEVPGLHDMHASTYAALLALAHIDGTFHPDRERYFSRIDGQHRGAARFALGGKTTPLAIFRFALLTRAA